MLRLKAHVASVCFKCWLFQMDVAKVDRDVSYVVIVVRVCCKLLFPMFHLFFRCMLRVLYLDITYVSHIYLQVFYLNVVYVFTMVSSVFLVFLQVFQTHISSVSSAFVRMLQVLHLNVSKIDRVLYMGCAW